MNDIALKASLMSCQAMQELSLREWDKNSGMLSYQVVQPNCERSQSLSDRDVESKLLKNNLSRRLCFTHDPAFKAGDYFNQLENVRQESYEQWTRRKDISGPYNPNGATNYDLDWEFFNCFKQAPPYKCVFNNGTGIVETPCPPKCGIHPTPCPNPLRN